MRNLTQKAKQSCIALFIFLFSFVANAQRTVTGRVTAASSNEPLAEATIQVKGTLVGTTTDADGRYSVYVPTGGASLIFSYTGFVSQEVAIGNKSILNIQLAEGLELDNVVVVGSRNATRTKLETPVPVDVIPIAVVVNEVGQVDLNQILNYVTPAFQSNRQTVSDGTDHVDPAQLRGMGPDQVLVLVNGKRRHTSALVNINGTVGRGSVGTDLSAIPISAIERVEILRDGAAAQYGSDAIAGIINIVLKKDAEVVNANLSSGITQKGDGATTDLGLNYGFRFLDKGFVNVSGQYTERGATNRMEEYTGPIYFQPSGVTGEDAYLNEQLLSLAGRTRKQADDDTLRQIGTNRKQFNLKVGNSALRTGGVFFNLNYPIGSGAEAYAFGGYNSKKGNAAGFYRLPNDVRNIKSLYPLGFLPEIHSTIEDRSLTLGLKGNLRGWNLDLSHSQGENNFDYRVENSLNTSLGLNTPISFRAGGFSFKQNTINFDINRLFGGVFRGMNVGAGVEYRADKYEIHAGEEASWKNYGLVTYIDTLRDANGKLLYRSNTIDQLGKAGGSQVFPGFRPENEINQTRTNASLYADVELDLTEKILVEAAVRHESYSDFGNANNIKLASRVKITKNFAIRGAVSTGFRAPSQQQKYFNNTSTQFISGVAKEVGTFTNDSRLAKEFGVPTLKQEQSINLSLGVTGRLTEDLEATFDIYSIAIKDRISLTGQFSSTSPEIAAILRNANAASAAFFTNAVDTKTNGADLVMTYNTKIESGTIKAVLAGNINKNTVVLNDAGKPDVKASEKIKNDPVALNTYFNREDQSRLEVANPNAKVTFTINYKSKNGKLGIMLRNVYFGQVKYLDPININDTLTWPASYRINGNGSFLGTNGINTQPFKNAFTGQNETFDQAFGGKIITDISATYQFTKQIGLTVGANNLLNVYPDKHSHSFNDSYGRFPYSRRVQQFGFNGSYYFARLLFVLR